MEECLYFKYASKEVDQNKLQGGRGGGSLAGRGQWDGWAVVVGGGVFQSMGCAPQFERRVSDGMPVQKEVFQVGWGLGGLGGGRVLRYQCTLALSGGRGGGCVGGRGAHCHTQGKGEENKQTNKQGPTAAPSAEVDCVLLWKHGYTRAL